jgi:uncharacterized repeat protein (TIGR01451 family)
VPAGSVISYSIGYGNLGSRLTNVIISETLPANTTLSARSAPAAGLPGQAAAIPIPSAHCLPVTAAWCIFRCASTARCPPA